MNKITMTFIILLSVSSPVKAFYMDNDNFCKSYAVDAMVYQLRQKCGYKVDHMWCPTTSKNEVNQVIRTRIDALQLTLNTCRKNKGKGMFPYFNDIAGTYMLLKTRK